ncbi:Protease-associated domain-containing protein like [Argiope bruennichi]|uniref:Protease-associated domain-containing protein like n=2 Tax=Argiope bruennichi TaxID=94029 RepID=A0A8T0FGJ8_ARGBR|nr:Protease-associated domain-containing protein like [Argiope bruennichi]
MIFIPKDNRRRRFQLVRINSIHSILTTIMVLMNIVFIYGLFDSNYVKEDVYFEIVEPETLHYTFRARPAQDFGVPFNSTYRNIGLVLAEPRDGCSAPLNTLELRNNIVLIDRGGCSFLSKCIQAERAGVVGAIICDNDVSNDEQYIDMIDDTTKRNCSIPAIFILGRDGFMIKKNLNTHNLIRAVINIPVNMTHVLPHQQKKPPWVLW